MQQETRYGSYLPYFSALPSALADKTANLPDFPVVYFVYVKPGIVLYVGATKNLRLRWSQHHWRNQLMEIRGLRIAWLPTDLVALWHVERGIINALLPPLNTVTGSKKDLRLKRFVQQARHFLEL